MPDPRSKPRATPLSATDILVDRNDPAVVTVTLNRLERRNAVTLAMWTELGRIFSDLSDDRAVRAVILTGAGGAFSAGADISEFPAVRATVEDGHTYEAAANRCQVAIASCTKPTIAAISGPCFGGGVGLALSCDFRVADASAYFAIPAARLSNVYGIVETRALFDAVGLAVTTHAADNTALHGAIDLAKSMSGSAPLTIKGAKVVLEAISRNETEQRKHAIEKAMDEAMASADYREGVAAFAAKRDPKFLGK